MNTDLLTLSNEALGAALRIMLTGLLATPERPTAEMAVQCYGPDFLASLSDDGSDTAAPLLGRESTPPREAMRPPPMPTGTAGAKAAPKKRAAKKKAAKTPAKPLAPKRATVGAKVAKKPAPVVVNVPPHKAQAAIDRQKVAAVRDCILKAGSGGVTLAEIVERTGVDSAFALEHADLMAYGTPRVERAGVRETQSYGVTIQAARTAVRRAVDGRRVAA